MDWKTTLHTFVKSHNQMRITYSIEPIIPFMLDKSYIMKQKKFLGRQKEGDRKRNIIPQKSVTRIQTIPNRVDEKVAVVHIIYYIQMTYLMKNKEFAENRMERELITFEKTAKGWMISDVQVYIPERRLDEQNFHPSIQQIYRKSIPYLNEQILSGGRSGRSIKYDRSKAKKYADTWWNEANPNFIHFDVDCTNFVSQCLYAGNAPMHYTGKRDQGWWYLDSNNQEKWSFSWSVSHSLYWYLNTSSSYLKAERVNSPEQLTIGDVIIYDWDGNENYQHSAIVADMDTNGMPLVNAHTANSKHRYWNYRDSYAWTERTKYGFFHINDYF